MPPASKASTNEATTIEGTVAEVATMVDAMVDVVVMEGATAEASTIVAIVAEALAMEDAAARTTTTASATTPNIVGPR